MDVGVDGVSVGDVELPPPVEDEEGPADEVGDGAVELDFLVPLALEGAGTVEPEAGVKGGGTWSPPVHEITVFLRPMD